MIKNEMLRIWVNRVFAFLAGGLIVFIILQFTIGSINNDLSKQNKALDEIKYESGRLLEESKLSFEKNDYENAKAKLNTLFEKHPASKEAIEGKTLYVEIEKVQEEADKEWDAVETGIRDEWEKSMTILWREELNQEFEKKRDTMEKEMDNKLESEWNKKESQIRIEWEKKI